LEGLFFELGPLVLNNVSGEFQVTLNPYSWNKAANMLFIDQPVGTGLSYAINSSSYLHYNQQIGSQFYDFLQKFYNIFPSFRTSKLFIFGESYAGIYIPTISTFILNQNSNLTNGNIKINLSGIGIGNGWVDPFTQYGSYSDVFRFAGLIDYKQEAFLNNIYIKCQSDLLNGKWNNSICDNIVDLAIMSSGNQTLGIVNVYDMRLYDPSGGEAWPSAVSLMEPYLRNPTVMEQIHVDNRSKWHDCDLSVFLNLTGYENVSTLHLLPRLIDNMPVLLYSGQFDLICPHSGTEEYLSKLDWQGTETFLNATRWVWPYKESDGSSQVAGYVSTAYNLTYALVLGCGHMVPYGQPASSYDMFYRFINNISFKSQLEQFVVSIPPKYSPNEANPLPIYGWVLICIASFALGSVLVAIIVVSIMKKRNNTSYHPLN